MMTVLFVVTHIPRLDRHLHRKYGAAFKDYARGTARLVPYVY